MANFLKTNQTLNPEYGFNLIILNFLYVGHNVGNEVVI